MKKLKFTPSKKHPKPPQKLVLDADGTIETGGATNLLAWYPDNFTVVAEHKAMVAPAENKSGPVLSKPSFSKRAKKKERK